MNNLFVPYVIAMLLKSIGFDEPCFAAYLHDGSLMFFPDNNRKTNTEHSNFVVQNIEEKVCTTPLYQEVSDWFLTNYNIKIDWDKGENPTNFYPVIKDYLRDKEHNYKYSMPHWFPRKELALNDAIILGIEIIEN